MELAGKLSTLSPQGFYANSVKNPLKFLRIFFNFKYETVRFGKGNGNINIK